MKYAGIEVTKVTTINQPVTVAIFLVSIDDDPSQRRPGKRADTQRGSAPRAIARAVVTTSRGMRNTWAASGRRAATGADGLDVILESTPPRPLRSSLAEGPIRDLGGWQTAVRESAPGLRSEAKGERALWVLAAIVG